MRLPGEFRVRLSSIEATEVTRELIAVMAANPERICPHLHISMQSGSDDVLRRMRRRWGAKRFLDRCRMFQESIDLPAVTTDIIVGFPGESEAEFSATCAVAREVGFSKIHIFPFSARRGTPAAEMADQVSEPVKADRVARLTELDAVLRRQYYSRLIGRRLRVVVEGSPHDQPHLVAGTSCRFATVRFPGEASLRRQLVEVEVNEANGDYLLGTPIFRQLPLR